MERGVVRRENREVLGLESELRRSRSRLLAWMLAWNLSLFRVRSLGVQLDSVKIDPHATSSMPIVAQQVVAYCTVRYLGNCC